MRPRLDTEALFLHIMPQLNLPEQENPPPRMTLRKLEPKQIVTIYRNGVGAAKLDGLQRFLSDQLYRSDKQLRIGPA